MADQDCSMCLNQSSDGDNEIQEAAFVEQGGMNENELADSIGLDDVGHKGMDKEDDDGKLSGNADGDEKVENDEGMARTLGLRKNSESDHDSGVEDDSDLEAKIRLEDDSSISVSSEIGESLEAGTQRLLSEIGDWTEKAFERFQLQFAKEFGISKDISSDVDSKPIKSAIEEDQELEEVEVNSNELVGHRFYFTSAFRKSSDYNPTRKIIKAAGGVPESEIDWFKLAEMEVSHLIGMRWEDLTKMKSDACDALENPSIRIYSKNSIIQAVTDDEWNCNNNIVGQLKL